MRHIIPFSKEIVFKTNIATITSISLEHEEKIFDGEVNGDFIIFGDYKVHSDTTEKELFKYRLPFTTLIPDNIIKDSVKIEIVDFNYEIIDKDVLKVDISFSLEGNLKEEVEMVEEDRKYEKELDQFLDNIIEKEEDIKEVREDKEEVIEPQEIEVKKEDKDEYITYHIHIVKEEETIEVIMKTYGVSLDFLKEYNDISNIKVGDKIIIPQVKDE